MVGTGWRAGSGFVTEAERQVAGLLPIEVDPVLARATVDAVPLCLHTFALNRAEGLYARCRARPSLPRLHTSQGASPGLALLQVGAFDGFYAFLTEHRGTERVVAVDNEALGRLPVGGQPGRR